MAKNNETGKENKEEKDKDNKERLVRKIEYFEQAFENAQNLAEFADSKANALITIHAVTVTIISAALFLEEIQTAINTTCDYFIIFLILILLLASASCAIYVIKPRQATDEKSLFYYMTIADHTDTRDYYKSFDKLSDTQIAQAYAHQAFEVSKIVKKKMQYVSYSLYLLLGYLFSLIIGSLIILSS